MSRKKYTSKFKMNVLLEALKERNTIAQIAQKHDIHPQQITNWKRDFLSKAEDVFAGKAKSKKTEAEEREEQLLKTIGHQKVEIDFLKNALR